MTVCDAAAFWRSAGGSIPDRRPVLDLSNETYSALFEPFWQRETAVAPSPEPPPVAEPVALAPAPGTVVAPPPTPELPLSISLPMTASREQSEGGQESL